jgi:hypothetical protein
LKALSNAAKAWLIAYHECVAVRILCVARSGPHNVSKRYRIESKRYRFATFLEIPEIQAIARFKSVRASSITPRSTDLTTMSAPAPESQLKTGGLDFLDD